MSIEIQKNINSHSLEIIRTVMLSVHALDTEAKKRIGNYTASQFDETGGFYNRAQRPDLYYTLFGLSCAYIMELELDYSKTLNYLQSFDIENLSLVELSSIAKCLSILGMLGKKIPERVSYNRLLDSINKFRTSNGSFSYDGRGKGFPYAVFLAMNFYQDLRIKPPDSGNLVDALKEYKQVDGRFPNPYSNSKGLILSTVAGLLSLRQLTGEINQSTLSWLNQQYTIAGGFKADQNSPLPDLLSTAVALFALRVCGTDMQKYRQSSREFITNHWLENPGCFTGTLADETGDCEYTYYGLLALGSIHDSNTDTKN